MPHEILGSAVFSLVVGGSWTLAWATAGHTLNELHRGWSKNADYRDAYDASGEEFDLARALIEEHGWRPACRSRSSPGR